MYQPEYSHSLMTFDHLCYNLSHSLQPLLLELTNHNTATLLQTPATPATTYQKQHNPLSDNLQPLLLSLTNQSTARSLTAFSHSCYNFACNIHVQDSTSKVIKEKQWFCSMGQDIIDTHSYQIDANC